MSGRLGFQPDWASAPGETIADILRERNLSTADFVGQMAAPSRTIDDLLEGRATITVALARRLSLVLGASVEFWLSRDFQYREGASRLTTDERQWLSDLPLGEMIRFGWLAAPRPSEELRACLDFFGVRSLHDWHRSYRGVLQAVSFRTSPSFDSRPPALAAWLRRGEVEAGLVDCPSWDRQAFHESLADLRVLTRQKDPARFIPELKERCAAHGVVVAVVRTPSGCRASGATRFVSGDKVLLLLSFRFLTDDQFWFSFFHEAGHLVLHNRGALCLEGTNASISKQEQHANEFAASVLIPDQWRLGLLALPIDGEAVIRFARKIGVAPGIVVGQMQHLGIARHRQLNGLKRRYRWKESELINRGTV
jgi:HTH-type transcriptional regulator/antitoxin HigA